MGSHQYSAILKPFFELSESEANPYELNDHDFLSMGITTAHIPELTELILDEEYYLDEEDLGYPQLFAYQALGQLKTPEAIDSLIQGTIRWDDSNWFEWFTEAMPEIFGRIGCPAVPAIVNLLTDTTVSERNRCSAVSYLIEIGQAHPDCREQCAVALTKQLEALEPLYELNGFIVAALAIDFKVVESAAAIKAAFAADIVDESIMGGWESAQIKLGLLTPDEQLLLPRKPRLSWQFSDLRESDRRDSPDYKKSDVQKATAKRKQQKDARRKNRRKK
jgi:hypothetical protein